MKLIGSILVGSVLGWATGTAIRQAVDFYQDTVAISERVDEMERRWMELDSAVHTLRFHQQRLKEQVADQRRI